jgi:hypothetical protein
MPMVGFLKLMAPATAVAMVTTMSASAAEIHVMSGGAPKEVFALLTPRFEQQTGIPSLYRGHSIFDDALRTGLLFVTLGRIRSRIFVMLVVTTATA